MCAASRPTWPSHLWEDDDLVDAQRARLSNVVDHVLAVCQAVDAWHAGDGLVAAALLVDEEGQDEVGGRQPRLPDAGAERLAAAVAARPRRQVLRGPAVCGARSREEGGGVGCCLAQASGLHEQAAAAAARPRLTCGVTTGVPSGTPGCGAAAAGELDGSASVSAWARRWQAGCWCSGRSRTLARFGVLLLPLAVTAGACSGAWMDARTATLRRGAAPQAAGATPLCFASTCIVLGCGLCECVRLPQIRSVQRRGSDGNGRSLNLLMGL